jgi:hypothetical protein
MNYKNQKMKATISFSVFCLLLSIGAFAQSDFVCYSGNGKVIMKSGDVIEGKVEFCLSYPGKVYVTPAGATKDTKYKCDEVKEFNIDDKQYVSLSCKGGAVTVGSDKAFVRLLTPVDYKLKLYISETQPAVVTDNNYAKTVMYYCQIPGDTDAAYALSDLKFTPFKKMAKYIADCPAIATKIENKEEGYTVPMMTTDEARKEVVLKIANEYQTCQ